MSYLSYLQETYPRTWQLRRAINSYNLHKEWEQEEPTTITIHETYLCYGGPEEGGWWYTKGWPVQTICIFSKKQAIKTYLQYAEEYQVWDQPDLGLTSTVSNYDISFANGYATAYPESRPVYC